MYVRTSIRHTSDLAHSKHTHVGVRKQIASVVEKRSCLEISGACPRKSVLHAQWLP
eukprot:m.323847 g.323847  ORF g.323847 m.323847 type:complete len:56 (-) comp20362_c0_seq4:2459-2626(-)